MRRRLATVVVPALLVIAAPATAAAQAPPDERAAARAFADAALRLATTVEALEPRYGPMIDADPPRCLKRLARRGPQPRSDDLAMLHFGEVFRRVGVLLEPALTQFSMALHAVQTSDPALRGGRTAWRRARRIYATLAAAPAIDVCAEAQRYADGGFEPTPAVRRARKLARLLVVDELRDFDDRVERTIVRLRRLGIPRNEASAFDGETEEPERG
jgi:hypothetical protein